MDRKQPQIAVARCPDRQATEVEEILNSAARTTSGMR